MLFKCHSCSESFLESEMFKTELGVEDISLPICTTNCTEISESLGSTLNLIDKEGTVRFKDCGKTFTFRKKNPRLDHEAREEHHIQSEWEPNPAEYASIVVLKCCACENTDWIMVVDEKGQGSLGPKIGFAVMGTSNISLRPAYGKFKCDCGTTFTRNISPTHYRNLHEIESGWSHHSEFCGHEWWVDDGEPLGTLVEWYPYERVAPVDGQFIGSGYICRKCTGSI